MAYRKPNRLDNFMGLPIYNGFLLNIQNNSHKIRQILESKSPPPCELKYALFVIDLNEFRADFIEITKILDRAKKEEEKVNSKSFLETPQENRVREFIFRAHQFSHWAFYYQEYFESRTWMPSFDIMPLFNIWLDFPFEYKDQETVLDNALKAEASFQYYQDYFKNFVNVFYGDKNEGEKFLGKEFRVIADEYIWLNEEKKEIQKIAKSANDGVVHATLSQLKSDLYKIFGRYPATVFLSMEEVLNYVIERSSR